MVDTTVDVERERRKRILAMTPTQRLTEGARFCDEARALIKAGIRRRHPEYAADQVEAAFLVLVLGPELYQRVRPGMPVLAP